MHYADESKFKFTTCYVDMTIYNYCSLPYCRNSKAVNKNLSYFVFPKSRKRCKTWLARCKRCYLHRIYERYGPHCLSMCCLCEEHFEINQFTDDTLRKRLFPSAVPTLFESRPSFYQRINVGASRKRKRSFGAYPCSLDPPKKLVKKEYYVQRLMPLLANFETYNHRFLHGLPSNLSIRKSNHPGAKYGVWCLEDIPMGTRYGPYDTTISTGTRCSPFNTTAALRNPNELKIHYFCKTDQQRYIEKKTRVGNSVRINWLQYVNLASNQKHQNLLVYQSQGKIYYLSYKPIAANTELLVWYGPYHTNDSGEKNQHYSMEELEAMLTKKSLCNRHRINWKNLREEEIYYQVQNLVDVLGIQGKMTKDEILKHVVKEVRYLQNRAVLLSERKSKESRRRQYLKEKLFFLTLSKGYSNYNVRKLNTCDNERSINHRKKINRKYLLQQNIRCIMQKLADILEVCGKTGKEILNIALEELKHLEETEKKLCEKKSNEERRCRFLKRRLLLTSKGFKNSSVESTYCIMCEHNYAYHDFS